MADETFEKLAYLAIGWLLGLLGPVITDTIKRRRENRLGRAAILSELRELGCVLSLAAYSIRSDQGRVDRKFMEWLKSDLERHATSEQIQDFVPMLRTLLSLSDAQIQSTAIYISSEIGKGTILQKYPVPLLDARVSALWSFDTSFQRSLLEVRQRLYFLDDLVESSRKYHDLTFATMDGANHRLVKENFNNACSLYAERAQQVVDMIRKVTKTSH